LAGSQKTGSLFSTALFRLDRVAQAQLGRMFIFAGISGQRVCHQSNLNDNHLDSGLEGFTLLFVCALLFAHNEEQRNTG
jgi:hypothetical protein